MVYGRIPWYHNRALKRSLSDGLQGIYFAAKSGRMCAEAIVEGSMNGTRMVDESDLRVYLDKWDRKYWGTYKVGAPISLEEVG